VNFIIGIHYIEGICGYNIQKNHFIFFFAKNVPKKTNFSILSE